MTSKLTGLGHRTTTAMLVLSAKLKSELTSIVADASDLMTSSDSKFSCLLVAVRVDLCVLMRESHFS